MYSQHEKNICHTHCKNILHELKEQLMTCLRECLKNVLRKIWHPPLCSLCLTKTLKKITISIRMRRVLRHLGDNKTTTDRHKTTHELTNN